MTDDQIAAGREVVRSILSVCRPEEIPLVDANFNSHRIARGTKLSDGMMGFGVEGAALLLMPFAIAFMKDFAGSALGDLAKKWGKGLTEWLTRSGDDAPQLEALDAIRKAFIIHLTKAGFVKPDAVAAGDALIATFVKRPELLRRILKLS